MLEKEEFIVNCTNNSNEDRREVYKWLVETRNYNEEYLIETCSIIACNLEEGASNWDNNLLDAVKAYPDHPIYTFEEFKKLINQKQELKKGMKEQMLNVLEKTYENPVLRKSTVPLFMSNPGIGKTNITEDFVREFIESKGNKMVTMVLPNLMPNEAVGGVYPNQITRVWEFYDSEKLTCLNDGDVLFLDEVFNGTLKQTLDSMLNVLGQRRLGSGKPMADVMIVAASNPQGLINLTPQIKERFIKYDLKFSKEEYQEYLGTKYGMPESISSNLCMLIQKEKFEDNWNFHTPRSIEKAINQIGCELESALDDVLLPYLKQTVKLEKNYKDLNYKKGEEIEYLTILRYICSIFNKKSISTLIKTELETVE